MNDVILFYKLYHHLRDYEYKLASKLWFVINDNDHSESYREKVADEICTTLDDLEQVFEVLEQKIQ